MSNQPDSIVQDTVDQQTDLPDAPSLTDPVDHLVDKFTGLTVSD